MAGEPRTVRRKLMRRRDARRKPDETLAPASPEVPRIARLLACAIVFEEMIERGEVRSYRELAAIGQVSTARISQVMGLLELAPGIQEQLLILPPLASASWTITIRSSAPLIHVSYWAEQTHQWRSLHR